MKNMNEQKNPLGEGSVGKLLWKLSLPAIVAQMVNLLYNMVDRIYIGHIPENGDLALTGLGLCFPIIMIVMAFANLIGGGGAPRVAIFMGRGEKEEGERIIGSSVATLLVIALIITVSLELAGESVLRLFGASDQTLPYAFDYMRVYVIGTVCVMMSLGLNPYITTQGFSKDAMKTVIIGAVANIILDPIFIFVLDMGIRGAAIATVISQLVSLIWQIKIFSNKEEFLHFSKDMMKFDSKIAYRSLSIGMAPFLMNVASCFIVILINKGLQTYGDMEMAGGGDLSIGAYGIINRLSFLFVMVVMGFTQGMQPIAGYNYGAQLYDRVIKVLRLTIICATIVMTAGFLVAMIFPELMVKIFTSDPQLIDLSSKGARLVFLAFPIIGFQIVTSNFFQSLGMAKKAIFLSLSRQLLFLAPCLIILPRFIGVKGVWLSLPISDIISTIVTIFMLRTLLKQFNEEIRKQRVITEGN